MLLGVALVVLGSLAHAVWNLLVKRAGASGVAFVWLYSALVTPVLLTLLVTATGSAALRGPSWAAVVSAALHTLYAVVLQRSYAVADLGVVYPVARAGAPVLVALAPVPLGAVAPAALWPGTALVTVGVALLAGARARSSRAALVGVLAGGATAVAVAAYTLWDGYAVTRLHVHVLSYLVVGSSAQLGVLTLAVARHPGRVVAAARTGWRLALPVAALVPLSYGLVLVALQHVPVQVVAVSRSTSILAAAVLGWWLLGETLSPRRLAGAAILTAGVVACTAVG